ncbi:MAG: aldehyde dehydrogenase family protein [Armatimonadaceae bacterium]
MTPPFHAETAAARVAQLAWANLPVKERLRPIGEFRRLLVERLNDITAAIEADVKRPSDQVVSSEVLPVADAAKWLETQAASILKPRRVSGRPMWLMGCEDVVYRRPWGVVAVVGTWNYPLFLNAVPVLHAMVAGNAVLWKPSENAPRFAEVFGTLIRDAGFPVGCFTMLPATREAGPMVAEADVDFVHFTGSEPVGRQLAKRLGERLIPSTLELSGCDAMFVLADANVELAARAAWYGATLNDGRTCMATRRVFVQRAAWEKFVAALAPLSPGGRGVGGEGGLHLNPPPDHPARRESTFTPTLAVLLFDTIDEALALHAESPFRLTASVFVRGGPDWGDTSEAERLVARLPVGSVIINDVIAPTAHPGTPFGGRGASGWGVTQGDEGLLQMTVPQTVTVHSGTFRPHVESVLTNDPAGGEVTAGMLRMAHGRTLGARWHGLMQMVRGMMKFGKR